VSHARYDYQITVLSTGALYEVSYTISTGQKEILESLKQQADILHVFVRTYIDLQEGKGTTPAHSQVSRMERPEDQTEQTIKAAEKDLLAGGIEKTTIWKHRDLIQEWLETVILPSEHDERDGSVIAVLQRVPLHLALVMSISQRWRRV
jgi:hypothetical protein